MYLARSKPLGQQNKTERAVLYFLDLSSPICVVAIDGFAFLMVIVESINESKQKNVSAIFLIPVFVDKYLNVAALRAGEYSNAIPSAPGSSANPFLLFEGDVTSDAR